MQKFSAYLEETQLKKIESQMNNEAQISMIGEKLKEYIINIDKKDIEKFVIIDGELIYIGKDKEEIDIAKELGIKVENKDLEELEVIIFVTDIANNKKEKQGIKLIDITGNSTYWAIVTEIPQEDKTTINKKYGTGYYYLQSGTLINDKNIKNNYILDYENKTVINCNSKEYVYSYLDINSSLGVTENLVLNLDAQNLRNSEEWGEGVTLYKYDETTYPDKEAFTDAKDGYDRIQITDTSQYIRDNAFIFNGNNYIEIYNENAFDFSEGITFEYYGKIDGHAGPLNGSYSGIFGIWNGEYESQPTVRFGIEKLESLYFNFAAASPNNASESSHPNAASNPWNQNISIAEKWNPQEDIYMSITLNKPKKEGEKAEYYIYINGEKYIDNGWICDAYWKGFVSRFKSLKFFEIGRCSQTKQRNWSYLIGKTYMIRVYNRYLTEDEITDNYNKTLAYHLI